MIDNIVIKFDPFDGKPYQINKTLNLISRVNLCHRRVEHRIYNPGKARFKIVPPMYGCFLSQCLPGCSSITCSECNFHYIKETL